MSTLQSFQANVSPRILTIADRLFTNRITSVLVELLQNARRSGATQVDVTTTESNGTTTIVFTDNGSGIDDFSALLSLGDSEWDESIQKAEDPAGMGFFSLLHSGVTVISKGERARFTKEMFLGRQPVFIAPCDDGPAEGTRLIFERRESTAQIVNALESVAQYGPTPVSINGKQITRYDFLSSALYVKEVNGIRIGVVAEAPYSISRCNFHGSVIDIRANDMLRLNSVRIQKEERGYSDSVKVLFDVKETSQLRLQLPDRSAIVEDEQYHALCHEARIALFEYLATEPIHSASFELYREAHSLGIPLKEAAPLLDTFYVTARDCDAGGRFEGYDDSDDKPKIVTPEECALVDLEDDTDDLYAFTFEVAQRFFQQAPLKPVKMNQKYDGYSWYDAMARYDNFALTFDGKSFDDRFKVLDVLQIVESIQLSFDLVQGRHTEHFSWDVPFAGFNHPNEEYPPLMVARHSEWVEQSSPSAGPFHLVNAANHLGFDPGDDIECDSRDTQLEYFENTVGSQIATVLNGSVGAAEYWLRHALSDYNLRDALNLARLTEVRLVKDQKGAWGFELGKPQTNAA